MQEGKWLRIRHIVSLEENNLNINDYLFLKEDAESYTFINKRTGNKICLRR